MCMFVYVLCLFTRNRCGWIALVWHLPLRDGVCVCLLERLSQPLFLYNISSLYEFFFNLDMILLRHSVAQMETERTRKGAKEWVSEEGRERVSKQQKGIIQIPPTPPPPPPLQHPSLCVCVLDSPSLGNDSKKEGVYGSLSLPQCVFVC